MAAFSGGGGNRSTKISLIKGVHAHAILLGRYAGGGRGRPGGGGNGGRYNGTGGHGGNYHGGGYDNQNGRGRW